ncbi:MAG: hypothetical protein AAF371_14915 [Pseudomonadota bacterium]
MAKALIEERGNISPEARSAFIEAGFDDRQAMEVVLGLAVKAMRNYTNSIARTPLEKAVAKHRWTKPRIAMRGAG